MATEPTNRPVTMARTPRPLTEPDLARGPVTLPAVPLAPADPAAGPAGPDGPPTMTALLHALRRRWLLAALLAVLGAAAAVAAVWLILPPQYTAHARILVASRQGHVLVRTEDETDFSVFKNNQPAI